MSSLPDVMPPTVRRYADYLRECAAMPGLRAMTPPADATAVADGAGHRRPAYPGLFAFVLHRLDVDVSGLVDSFGGVSSEWPVRTPSGSQAEELTRRVWCLLAIAAVNDDPALLGDVCRRIADQRARFADDGSNPEPRWYAELVTLHALTTAGAWTGDVSLLQAAADAAAYHQAETQPDHATGQPWGIHAALLQPATLPLADLLLLPVAMPDGRSVVNRLLLADAAHAMESPAFLAASGWQ